MTVQHGQWCELQFIKNFQESLVCKPFKKDNIVEAWYNQTLNRWVHYTPYNIHFIPVEYVKICKLLNHNN